MIEFLKGIQLTEVIKKYPPNIESSLKNIGLAINELRKLKIEIQSSITPESVYNSEDSMFQLLEAIKKGFDSSILNKNHNESPKPKEVHLKYEIPSTVNPIETKYTNRQDIPQNKPPIGINKTTQESPITIRQTNKISGHKATLSAGNPIEITKVSNKAKFKLFNWLKELRIIKGNEINIDNFPEYCRNGILFSDLISELEGTRKRVLNGIMRNPKTKTESISNIKICLKHMQNYEKMKIGRAHV